MPLVAQWEMKVSDIPGRLKGCVIATMDDLVIDRSIRRPDASVRLTVFSSTEADKKPS